MESQHAAVPRRFLPRLSFGVRRGALPEFIDFVSVAGAARREVVVGSPLFLSMAAAALVRAHRPPAADGDGNVLPRPRARSTRLSAVG